MTMKDNMSEHFYKISNEITDLLHKTTLSQAPNVNLGKSENQYLKFLHENQNQQVKMKDLSRAIGVSHSRITHLTDSLAKKGFVIREYSSDDRRVYYAKLTEKAIDLLNDDSRKRINIYNNLIKNMPLKKAKELLQALELWKNQLETLIKDGK